MMKGQKQRVAIAALRAVPGERCTAISSTTGERCQRWRAAYGGELCGLHFHDARRKAAKKEGG